MEAQKGEYVSDYLARGFAVVAQVEGVRRVGVIHERHGQVVCQRFAQETIKRFVQAGKRILPRTRDEQRQRLRKIGDASPRARVGEAPHPCSVAHAG